MSAKKTAAKKVAAKAEKKVTPKKVTPKKVTPEKVAEKKPPREAAPAPAAPPPPVKAKAAKPGEVPELEWTKVGRWEWNAPDPSGVEYIGNVKAGSVIKEFFMGPRRRWHAYRDTVYLGSVTSFEEAKDLCRYHVMTIGAQEWRERIDEIERTGSVAGTEFMGKPAIKDAVDPYVKAASESREAREARRLRNEMKADRAAAKLANKAARGNKKLEGLEPTSIIKLKVDKNPRKEGSGAAKRFEVIMQFEGKPVSAFLAGGGHAQALINSLAAGWVELETA